MGLFDWLKPKVRTQGPDSEGLYGELPRGAQWIGGTDPAGDPQDFVPGPDAYVFDIAEWRWDEHLWIGATTNASGNLAGFGLVLVLSDGAHKDAVEVWESGRRGPVLKGRHEWIIPRGHPTRELAFVSHGDQTTQILRKLEKCFGFEPTAYPALPDKTAVICELGIVRGIINPDEGRFTARMKAVFQATDHLPYCEFFLHVNSVRRQIWVSEKAGAYRSSILSRIADLRDAKQGHPTPV